MNSKIIHRIISFSLAILLLFSLVSCGNNTNTDGATTLSFKSASGYDYLKSLDGKQVEISGYMATSSPADGSFIFLMNLPYQSCPFCKPNTTQLSNTMEVYPKKNQKFLYTTQAIKVTGTLVVAKTAEDSFTDPYGYKFNFKITDAVYTIIKAGEMSEKVALWQKIADTDVISEIYRMYDYVNFICTWNTYYVSTYTDENGATHPGYYLYPSDALNYLTNDGAQWNYGYKDGYFEDIISKINAVDASAFSNLTANIQKAQALAAEALAELNSENYTFEYKYVEDFGTEDYVYTLNNGEKLTAKMDEIYTEFADWLGSWEM